MTGKKTRRPRAAGLPLERPDADENRICELAYDANLPSRNERTLSAG